MEHIVQRPGRSRMGKAGSRLQAAACRAERFPAQTPTSRAGLGLPAFHKGMLFLQRTGNRPEASAAYPSYLS